MKRKRISSPHHQEGPLFDAWGRPITPSFPYKVDDILQGFRDGVVLKELLFLRCTCCTKEFAIRRFFCQKDVLCPYCGQPSEYVEPRGKYLFRLCAELIGRRKLILARKKANENI